MDSKCDATDETLSKRRRMYSQQVELRRKFMQRDRLDTSNITPSSSSSTSSSIPTLATALSISKTAMSSLTATESPGTSTNTADLTTSKAQPPGNTIAIIGPSKMSFRLNREIILNSSRVFHSAASLVSPTTDLELEFPNLNVLDFKDYMLWLITKPELPVNSFPAKPEYTNAARNTAEETAMMKEKIEYNTYHPLIALYNTAHELCDVRLQNTCCDHFLRIYLISGVFPHHVLLILLLPNSKVQNLVREVYVWGCSRERFEENGGRWPFDFSMGVLGRLMCVRDGIFAEEGEGLWMGRELVRLGMGGRCEFHVHDGLCPRSECASGEEVGHEGEAVKAAQDGDASGYGERHGGVIGGEDDD